MLEFLYEAFVLLLKLAFFTGTLAGIFLLTCFLIGWVVETIRRNW
jgi:hypothetical protein